MSDTARRGGPLLWLGSVLFMVWMFGLALVLGIVCLPLLLGSRRGALKAIRQWMRWVMAGLRVTCGIKVVVRGLENLPKGGCIVAAKHQGMLDIMPPFAYLDDPAFILKKSLMAIPIFGWFAAKAGMIPIDREGAAKTLRAMMGASRAAVEAGRQVVIFPEGTRRAPGEPTDYKPGVAGMYRELNVPCVPVATNSGRFWPPHGLLKFPGVAVFEILPPIPPGLKRGEFMRRLEADIEAATARLAAE